MIHTAAEEQEERLNWPARILWFASPDEDDPSVLVEIVEIDPATPRHIWPETEDTQGEICCPTLAEALASIPLLQLEVPLVMWRGVYAIRTSGEEKPRLWKRIPYPVPGQEWPANIEPGGCLACGATGACYLCGNNYKDNVICPCIYRLLRHSATTLPYFLQICYQASRTHASAVHPPKTHSGRARSFLGGSPLYP